MKKGMKEGNAASVSTAIVRIAVLCACLGLAAGTVAPQLGMAGSGVDGKAAITTFEAPGAGTAASEGTLAYSINKAGAIAGWYVDSYRVIHGFARAPGGAITAFDPPGSAQTYTRSINTGGAIAGFYEDANYAYHGFVRAASGAITTFDPPTPSVPSLRASTLGGPSRDITVRRAAGFKASYVLPAAP